ncbi:lipopolysaccharide biosynthesis protein [Bacillus massilioanorexius]|uniref:lipopolysaccharide biosynthesis protein n=1 Tax=Bacillus massilioanorexius TaxID=1468413 RepID=UPI0011DCFADC|nr:hypothetical protein [Bacillus massilioanorexius]
MCRTVFIAVLGAEYLGVSGLYSSILMVLSLAELGIANVMIYSLYKPIRDQDEGAICALLNYYKKIYKRIAIAVLLFGISIVPILHMVINSNLTYNDLVLYYLIFLLNSVVSYFVAYKTALINADQKNYIITFVGTACALLTNILQIIVLVIIKSFTLYLIIMVIGTVLNNIILSIKADKLYPYIKQPYDIAKSQIKEINKNIRSMFLFKIGHVVMNNTDNILISMMVGTIYVGYYSNYFMLVNVVSSFISIIIQSLHASIGNLNAESNVIKSYKFFNMLLLFFHWLSAFSSLCFLVVFADFITIWIGESYLLDSSDVIAIVFNFYIQNIVTPVWIYRETLGLFNQIKYIMLCAAIVNLILSIVLGSYWGLAGIIISTAFARMLTNVWVEPRLLFHKTFEQPVSQYWNRQIKYFITTIIAVFITVMITDNMPVSLLFIILKVCICFFIMTVTFLIANFKTEELRMLYEYIQNFICKSRSIKE